MIDRAAIREMLRRGDNRFAMICEFNADPIQYIDPSHLDGVIAPEFVRAATASPRGRNRLSGLVLDHWGLREKVCFEFEDARRRLALVDKPSLQNLLLYTGAALQADRIARLIEREPLAALKRKLGERVYEFAVKRARFLVPNRPAALRAVSGDLFLDVRESGRRAVEACLAGEPDAVTERVALKFPAGTCWDFPRAVSDGERQEAWQFLKRVFLKEVGPQWSVCLS